MEEGSSSTSSVGMQIVDSTGILDSAGQNDPLISVMFTLSTAALTVVTLGVRVGMLGASRDCHPRSNDFAVCSQQHDCSSVC